MEAKQIQLDDLVGRPLYYRDEDGKEVILGTLTAVGGKLAISLTTFCVEQETDETE